MADAGDIRWAVALTTSHEDEAVFAQGYLREAGIECIVEDAKFLHASSESVGGIRLLVPEAQAAEAKALIEQAQRGAAKRALADETGE